MHGSLVQNAKDQVMHMDIPHAIVVVVLVEPGDERTRMNKRKE